MICYFQKKNRGEELKHHLVKFLHLSFKSTCGVDDDQSTTGSELGRGDGKRRKFSPWCRGPLPLHPPRSCPPELRNSTVKSASSSLRHACSCRGGFTERGSTQRGEGDGVWSTYFLTASLRMSSSRGVHLLTFLLLTNFLISCSFRGETLRFPGGGRWRLFAEFGDPSEKDSIESSSHCAEEEEITSLAGSMTPTTLIRHRERESAPPEVTSWGGIQ